MKHKKNKDAESFFEYEITALIGVTCAIVFGLPLFLGGYNLLPVEWVSKPMFQTIISNLPIIIWLIVVAIIYVLRGLYRFPPKASEDIPYFLNPRGAWFGFHAFHAALIVIVVVQIFGM